MRERGREGGGFRGSELFVERGSHFTSIQSVSKDCNTPIDSNQDTLG